MKSAENKMAAEPGAPESGAIAAAALSRLITELSRTREAAVLVRDLAPEFTRLWAGKNPFRKILARIAGRSVARSFARRAADPGSPRLAGLLSDPAFLDATARGIPAMGEAIMDAASSAVACVEAMPAEGKAGLIGSLRAGDGGGRAGEILTSLARIVNDLHRLDPTFFARLAGPSVRALVASTDFGEMKEFVDLSAEDIVESVRVAGRALWEYPAKAVCLAALIPSVINLAMDAARASVAPVNNMPPDLLADVALSLVRELNGGTVGGLINEMCELVRKVHTGSALIGDHGRPRLPEDLSGKAEEVCAALDIPLLLKARSCMAEMRESTAASIAAIIEKNPGLAGEFIQDDFKRLAARIRAWGRRAESYEAVFTDEELARALERGMRELDAQLLGDTLIRVCEHLNRAHGASPGFVRDFLSQVAGSTSGTAIGDTTRWLVADLVVSLKPLARDIMPPVVRGLAELLDPDLYDDPSEMEDALASLRKALRGGDE